MAFAPANRGEPVTGAFAALHFLRPEWLWGLLALPLLVWSWRQRRRRDDIWRGAVDAQLLPHLVDRSVMRQGVGGLVAQCVAWTIAVFALAGPSWRMGEQPLAQGGLPMVVALDLSSATLAGDLPPSRLLQARARLVTLLRQRNGQPTGLVAYAGDAFTVAPLSEDTANIALFLDALAPDIMPVDGSNAAHAISLAQQLLVQAGHARGDILLLSDHADADARAAAARAAAAGYRVSALGLGTADGAAYRRGDGSIAQARLDAGTLRALATAGNGAYAAMRADARDLAALASPAGSEGDSHAADGSGARVWRDEGYWLLLPVMLLALFAFRRGAAVVAVVLCLGLPLSPARAADGGLWQRADQAQHARMREGIDAYRAGDYAEAMRSWDKLPGADAAYNRGNALAKQGRYEDAIAAYDKALKEQPGMADAIANRKAVEAAMKRRPPSGGGDLDRRPGEPDEGGPPSQPPDGQGNPGDPSQEAREGNNEGERRDDPSADTSRAQERDEGGADAQAPQPDTPRDQREADEAQRRQMQRALQRQGGTQADDGEQVEGDPDRAESAAQREKRQANEAWLRRIPDDPGGLLRAKFRLEHERRNGITPEER